MYPCICLRRTGYRMSSEVKRGLSSGVAGLRYGQPKWTVKAQRTTESRAGFPARLARMLRYMCGLYLALELTSVGFVWRFSYSLKDELSDVHVFSKLNCSGSPVVHFEVKGALEAGHYGWGCDVD